MTEGKGKEDTNNKMNGNFNPGSISVFVVAFPGALSHILNHLHSNIPESSWIN